MTQTFWDTEVAVEPKQDLKPAEMPAEPAAEPATLALSADDFSALEERIVRAVELVKRERQARADAEERAAKAEAELAAQVPMADQLKQEVRALRAERDLVRRRVEHLLSQLDALEL
ncbi:MAG: hypothetical protein WCA37_15505 [Terracidiphilus sp.]